MRAYREGGTTAFSSVGLSEELTGDGRFASLTVGHGGLYP
jgi:hypothetical protein